MIEWIEWLSDPMHLLTVAEVAFGLGMVIFVHELGHFAVAKWCGVKCEKFYLGFDIYGLKLLKFRYGETEYGIGALPLGGYVKMLGQDDNPARAAEELERSKLAATEGETSQPYTLDPRSYLAKSVPRRMAIISAGVIMNVLFAWIMATACHMLGVNVIPCYVGEAMPGGAAWTAGIRGGDDIVRINHIEDPTFDDLMQEVMLGDLKKGVEMEIRRPNVDQPIEFLVTPNTGKQQLAPRVGIGSLPSLTLNSDENRNAGMPALPNTPAAAATPAFAGGDTIVAVDGQPVANSSQLDYFVALNANQPVVITVERAQAAEGAQADSTKRERVDITVEPRPRRTLGFTWEWGPIVAVQEGSPAAAAGILPGDKIMTIDGRHPGDPERFPALLRRLAGTTVRLELNRGDETIAVDVPLREVEWIESAAAPGYPLSAPELGIAYRLLNRIDVVLPNTDADRAKLGGPRAQVVEAIGFALDETLSFDAETEKQLREFTKVKFDFVKNPDDVPYFMYLLDRAPSGLRAKLSFEGGDDVSVLPAYSRDDFSVDRGWVQTPIREVRTAASLVQAMALGAKTTKDWLSQIFKFLGRIGRQVSVKAIGGPIAIFGAAGQAAQMGLSEFLWFLGMLSANLAVINFLPIPMLDGGHMVFLALEGIRGKPVSERVVAGFHMAGLLLLLTLIVFVMLLDTGLISRTG